MIHRKVTINNLTGLHLRPAAVLCKKAMEFQSHITFEFKNGVANAKSVLSILGACVKNGEEIDLYCEGADEKEALEALIQSIESGLGE